MKTKELIEKLKELDPTGETECCIGSGTPIYSIRKNPAYYDGALGILQLDKSNPYYNVVGIKYTRTGYKICLKPCSVADAIGDDSKVMIDYSEIGPESIKEEYIKTDNQMRLGHDKIDRDCEWNLFSAWAREQCGKIAGAPEDVDTYAKIYFDKNIDPNAPLPTEKTPSELNGSWVWDSYNNRRKFQWSNEIEIKFENFEWHFERKTK